MATKPFDFRQAKLGPHDPQPGGRIPEGYRVVTISFLERGVLPINVILNPTQASMRWTMSERIKLLSHQTGTVASIVDAGDWDSKLR